MFFLQLMFAHLHTYVSIIAPLLPSQPVQVRSSGAGLRVSVHPAPAPKPVPCGAQDVGPRCWSAVRGGGGRQGEWALEEWAKSGMTHAPLACFNRNSANRNCCLRWCATVASLNKLRSAVAQWTVCWWWTNVWCGNGSLELATVNRVSETQNEHVYLTRVILMADPAFPFLPQPKSSWNRSVRLCSQPCF